jgi:hypothetical protein
MPSFQITERIKQDVRNARFIGEFTMKIGAQKLPGIIWEVVSRVRNSVYPPVPRATEPCDGYDLLTGKQIVELLQSVSEVEARDIHDYECTHRNRAVIIAAAQSRITVQ